MQCQIDLEFADGEYTFALPLPQIDELQTKCGIGIGGLFARVYKGYHRVGDEIVQVPDHAEFYASDIVETIRQGLIGGGKGIVDGAEVKVTPAIANRLVANYVLVKPLSKGWSTAASILAACIVGYEPPKKAPPAEGPAKQTVTAD